MCSCMSSPDAVAHRMQNRALRLYTVSSFPRGCHLFVVAVLRVTRVPVLPGINRHKHIPQGGAGVEKSEALVRGLQGKEDSWQFNVFVFAEVSPRPHSLHVVFPSSSSKLV